MESKQEIRDLALKNVNRLTSDEKSMASTGIVISINCMPQFINAKCVALYWPLHSEVNLTQLLLEHHKDKIMLLPFLTGDAMGFKRYTGSQNMVAGKAYGIPEPVGSEFTTIDDIDLIFVPGVAFDKELNRMGRGKGYYDRFLSSFSGTKVGICFPEQCFDRIPADDHDVKMDMIIC